MPNTGFRVTSRTACNPGIGEAREHEGGRAVVAALDHSAERHDDAVDMMLGLDSGRALGQRQALELGGRVDAEVLESGVDAVGHLGRRVGVDDDDMIGDAIGHGAHSGGGSAPVRSVIRP